MHTIRVAVVGQPNVGKTHLLNGLSGATLHVGNFAGVTVEKKEVQVERNGYRLILTDLPGIYSLHTYTPEESITKHYLLQQQYDVILNVVDSNVLERNLMFTLQLLDQHPRMVLAANMYDEVRENKGTIDSDRLSDLLGISVVLTSAKKKQGLEKMLQKLINSAKAPQKRQKIYYNESIESAINELQPYFGKEAEELNLTTRFIAIRLLEYDSYIYKLLHDKPAFFEASPVLRKTSEHLKREFDEDDVKTVLFNERAASARGLTAQISIEARKESLTDKIDDLLIHPVLGVPIFLFLMWGLFQLTFTLGSIPMDYIEAGFNYLQYGVEWVLPASMLTKALSDGIIPAVGAIFMFLPNILILFFGLNLLEQTGYMARTAFLLDGFLKRFGLQGNAFIPLVSGFGCSVPAYMAARTLKNPKDRIITMLVIGFMSCGAKLPVYVLFVGAFFPAASQGNVLFGIYIFGALLGLVSAKVLRMILFKGIPEPFVMEMPKYRVPSLMSLGLDIYGKTKVFIKKAGTFIALAAFLVWLLSTYPLNSEQKEAYISRNVAGGGSEQVENAEQQGRGQLSSQELKAQMVETSFLGHIGRFIEPVFRPMGFDWQLSVATLTALAAKEIAVSTLAVLYHESSESLETSASLQQTMRQHLDFKTAIAFILVMLTYSPCIAAMSTFYSEVPQWSWRTLYTIYPNLLAWVLGVLAYQSLALLGM